MALLQAAPVAIKVVDGIFNSTTDAKRTLRELSILRQCDHPNVIKCHAVLSPPADCRRYFTNLWIVLDLAKTDLGIDLCVHQNA